MEEVWKDVINGKYMLSKSGILVHKRTRKVVKGRKDKSGYIYDSFWFDGKKINKYRHRLVFETFIGEIPKDMEVNHINEDKTDNNLSNLNLLTHKSNISWGTRNERIGKANSKSVVQKTLQGEVVKIWSSVKEIQRELGYSNGNIASCCRGGYFDNSRGKWHSCNTAYGYIWEYYTEEKATA